MLKEKLLDGNHIVISVELNDDVSNIPTFPLIDSGATGYAFADEEYARDYNLPLFKLKTPRSLEVIDGRLVQSGAVSHLTKLNMRINCNDLPEQTFTLYA